MPLGTEVGSQSFATARGSVGAPPGFTAGRRSAPAARVVDGAATSLETAPAPAVQALAANATYGNRLRPPAAVGSPAVTDLARETDHRTDDGADREAGRDVERSK